MVATTEHDDAIASLLQLMISLKNNHRIAVNLGWTHRIPSGLFPDKHAAEQLLSLLYRDNTNISWIAAHALALIDDDALINRLLQQLEKGGAAHQAKTALALACCGDRRAVPKLLAALCDEDWLVRELVCESLCVLEDTRAISPLARIALEDAESRVRNAAVEALGGIGSLAVLEPLIQALRDPDQQVRATAALQLGTLQYPQAIEPLSSILQADPDATVRCSAIQALSDMLFGEEQRSIQADGTMTRGVEQVIAALQDESPEVRAKAAGALEDLPDSRAFAPLIKAMDDPDTVVRCTAANTLAEIQTFHTDDAAVVEKIRRLLCEYYGR